MDDEAGIDEAVPHGGHDLVERHDHDFADAARNVLCRPEAEQQVRGRALARHGDPAAAEHGRVWHCSRCPVVPLFPLFPLPCRWSSSAPAVRSLCPRRRRRAAERSPSAPKAVLRKRS